MNWRRSHTICAILCGGLTLLFLISYFLSHKLLLRDILSPLLIAEYHTEDIRLRHGNKAPVDDRLVFLGVDKQTYTDELWPEEIENSKALQLMTEKQFPWSREVWALVAERLIENGAQLVIIDLLFPKELSGDAAFRKTLDRYSDKIIIGSNFAERSSSSKDGTGIGTFIRPSDSILGDYIKNDTRVGLVNFFPDHDYVVRRLRFNFQIPKTSDMHPTIAGLAAIKLGIQKDKHSDTYLHRFRYAGAPQEAFRFHPIYQIFAPSMWESNYQSGKYFENKIVVIGPSANWTQDLHQTPFALKMFGPEIHLHALNSILTDSYIKEPSFFTDLLIICLSGLIAFAVMFLENSVIKRVIALIIISISYYFICWISYNSAGYMLILVTPLLTFNSSGIACMIYQFVLESIEKAKTRSKFESYISQNVVKLMLDSPDFEKVLEGVRLPCTILFSDIRGFTTITESSDSHALVSQLNEYFTEMVECVFQNNGTLDKFIGDAVMAVWGNAASKGPQQDAIDCVNSSLEMLTALEKLNRKWREDGRLDLAIGIGINHGQVIVGDMGSPKKKEFTVIGDAVNLASRIEGTTKKYGLQLCIGESVANLVKDHFLLQKVDLIQVKGKTRPVQTYTVAASLDTPPDDSTKEGIEIYHRAIDAFLKQEFDTAIEQFTSAQILLTRSRLPTLYIERCKTLKQSPPPEDWDGVYVLTEK